MDGARCCSAPTVGRAEAGGPDARLWHPWLRINRVLRVMLHTRWNTEAWSVVRVEFRRALAVRSEIRRAGRFN
jgi:hypothetical protein